MTNQEFKKGMETIETALQGKFQDSFMTFVWKSVKDVAAEDWKDAVGKLALLMKKPQDLFAGDFLEALREVANERYVRDAKKPRKLPPVVKPAWKEIEGRVCADPSANELSRSIAKRLAIQKGAPEAQVKGGEKYRRQGS